VVIRLPKLLYSNDFLLKLLVKPHFFQQPACHLLLARLP